MLRATAAAGSIGWQASWPGNHFAARSAAGWIAAARTDQLRRRFLATAPVGSRPVREAPRRVEPQPIEHSHCDRVTARHSGLNSRRVMRQPSDWAPSAKKQVARWKHSSPPPPDGRRRPWMDGLPHPALDWLAGPVDCVARLRSRPVCLQAFLRVGRHPWMRRPEWSQACPPQQESERLSCREGENTHPRGAP